MNTDAQLDEYIKRAQGHECAQISLFQAAKNDPFAKYMLGPSFAFAFILGPGLGLIDIGINYCISFTSGLFIGIITCYLVMCVLVLLRLVLEFNNTLFCSQTDALWVRVPVFVTFMNLGGIMTLYVFYSWCHNLFAFAGSGLCAILFLVFYFVSTLHHHSRFCMEESHCNKASVYQRCGVATQVIDFFVLIATLGFYITAFWLDGDLNFDGRPANKCLLIS